MSFDAKQTEEQITHSIGAMLLLHSSNQSLIEVSVTPSASSWYKILNDELGSVQHLVVDWRQNGFLYFQQGILRQIVTCGQSFVDAQVNVEGLFKKLVKNFDAGIKQQIMDALGDLEAPVNSMVSQLEAYSQKLGRYEKHLNEPLQKMLTTASEIQSQAVKIQSEINTINAQIKLLKKQVITDRRAISKAKAARTRGIIETIFGILLAPITGGASLILAGIGVGTIAEAEEKVKHLESTIAGYQTTIAGDQKSLTNDEKQIATLHGLTMSVEIAISDINDINVALNSLRTTWGVLLGSLQNAVKDVDKATTAKEAILGQVWFDAACDTWQNVIVFTGEMAENNAPEPTHVMIG